MMSKEGFFRRWARLKSQGGGADASNAEPGDHAYLRAGARAPSGTPPVGADTLAGFEPVAQTAPHPPVAPVPQHEQAGQERKQPTLEDVALLGPDSDFSAFVSQGVDKAVQRLAMKKLFSDPHFNLLDGLDVYIDDYTRADPIPAAMLASMQHARSVFAKFLEDENKKPGEPGDEPNGQPPNADQPRDPPPQDNA